jgi:hypothetical protein
LHQIDLFPVSLEQSIDPDNEVRIIDLFVDCLSLKDFGFRTDFTEMVVRLIIRLICSSSSFTAI